MKYVLRYSLLSAVLLLFIAVGSSQAQYRMQTAESVPLESPPAVLYPEPTYWFLGLFIGADMNMHTGEYYTSACERIFSDAEGEGIYIGAQLEHRMNPMFSWVLRLAYNDYSATDSYVIPDVPTDVADENNQTTTELLDHTYTSDITLSYFSINPMIEYYPVGNLYLFAGPAVGFLMDGTYTCRDEVSDEFFFDRNQEDVTTEDSEDIPEASALRIDLRGGIGYNLRLSSAITIAPEIGYNYALTGISDANNWDVAAHAFTAIAVLKIDL